MADIIKLCPLGGLDEDGRDCYVLEINNSIFVLDCGAALPDKTIPGIDFLLPNARYLIENKDRIAGYFITHGHSENMSGLKYFYEMAPAPVYATKHTIAIMEDQARSIKFKVKFNWVEVLPTDKRVVAGRVVHFFQTCHNASQSYGLAIETDRGNIVYTGDFIVDYSQTYKDYLFDLKKLNFLSEKETFLLLAESKRSGRSGYCAPKHRLFPLIEKYFKDSNKRIFIDCFWQNTYRITEILQLCKMYHKKIYFYNQYTNLVMTNTYLKINPNSINPNDIVSKEDLLRVREQDLVILLLGRGQDLYKEIAAISSGTNEDKRIVLGPKDIFINCALATPTLETLATRSVDSLYRTGCEMVWIKSKDLISMHACQDDLKFFLSLLKPKYYLPVRGSFRNLMENAKLAVSMNIGLNHMNTFIIDNGMQLVFDATPRPQIIPNEANGIPIEPVLVDGKGISKVGEEVIKDRRKLGIDGVVVVAATVSLSQKAIIAGPDCQMRGFVYVKEAEPLLKSISNIFVEEINTALSLGKTDFEDTKELIKDRARKFIRRENGRDPEFMPIIIAVE